MRKQQSGFTLIELVMVIVILGILAATALPKFVDLQTDAANAAADGVYGGAQAAAAINYSKGILNKPGHTAITTGATLLDAMQSGVDWTASGTTLTTTMASTTYTITINTVEDGTTPAILSKSW